MSSDWVALDRALAPLRRLIDYATQGEVPRYFEVNARRWLQRALEQPLPTVLEESLRQSAEELEQVTGGESALEWAVRTRGRIRRVDALLGLPMAEPIRAVHRPRFAQRAETQAAPLPDSPPVKGASGAGVKEPAPRAEGPFWNGDLRKPLRELDGLAAVAERMAAVGWETVADLVLTAPVDEEIVRPVHGAGREVQPGRVAIGGRVRQRYSMVRPGQEPLTRVVLHGAGPLLAEWSGPGDLDLDELPLDERVVLVGDLGDDGVLRDAEVSVDDGKRGVRLQRYGVEGLSDREVRGALRQLLRQAHRVRDPLPTERQGRDPQLSLAQALRDAHLLGAEPAFKRLAFDEALSVFIGLGQPRFGAQKTRGFSHSVVHEQACTLARLGRFELDDSQQVAMEDIKRDLRDSRPMRRLLAGPPGDGKGTVALIAMTIVAENKHQVLYVAPDPIAAESRFLFAEPLFKEVGLVARLVDGKVGGPMRDAIRSGNCHLIFATPEILSEELSFRRLGLVVYEEPVRWGGATDWIERLGTPSPDLLVHSGVSLPRAAVLGAYPNFDLTWLEQEERSPVVVSRREAPERVDAYKVAAAAVERGRQALIVFPTAKGSGSDLLDAREANQVISALRSDALPEGARVLLYHGGMSREERHRVYMNFRHHRCDVLVATFPPEIGPDVPMLTVTIAERAEHLSSLRLRRLRGQLERTLTGGELVLVVGNAPERRAEQRMGWVMAKKSDTWIAEQHAQGVPLQDLLAGSGDPPRLGWDSLGTRSGVVAARAMAMRVLQEDADLRRTPELAKSVRLWWQRVFPDVPCPIPEPAGSRRRRRRRRKK